MLNVNLGILGHVDAGKTSLTKLLATHASTAAFDKHPQSQERGITLDLGFSSFVDTLHVPQQLKEVGYDTIQYTMVDCPGHASLIRTVMGGATIMDLMLLVIDSTKGIQTQTAECIVIAEILCNDLIIIMNKTDLIQDESELEKMKKNILKAFSQTKFKNPPLFLMHHQNTQVIGKFIEYLSANYAYKAYEKRIVDKKQLQPQQLLFAIDHCFPIKGKGTVITGTILQGTMQVNQTIHIPILQEEKKIKSIQVFHQSVDKASQGDRVGILVLQFAAHRLERGYACDSQNKDMLQMTQTIVAQISKVKYFKHDMQQKKTKYHITVGHNTCMGTITLFDKNNDKDEWVWCEQCNHSCYVRIDLESFILIYPNAKLIASKLDTDIHNNECRIVFHGNVMLHSNIDVIYKYKSRKLMIDRIQDDYTLIAKYSSKNIQYLLQKQVQLQPLQQQQQQQQQVLKGTIDSAFGSSGKFKILFKSSISQYLKSLSIEEDCMDKKFKLHHHVECMLHYKVNINEKKEFKTWIQ